MRKVVLLGLCACAIAAAAEPPYAGKWKMNAAKSNFGESTITYEQLAGGEMKATMDGLSYTFKTDGKDNNKPDIDQVDASGNAEITIAGLPAGATCEELITGTTLKPAGDRLMIAAPRGLLRIVRIKR